jgi:ABC-type Fe3+-siderophore transport system permease subunit
LHRWEKQYNGSGAAAILIYALSYKKGEGISPTRLLLSGIGVAISQGSRAITNFQFEPHMLPANQLATNV